MRGEDLYRLALSVETAAAGARRAAETLAAAELTAEAARARGAGYELHELAEALHHRAQVAFAEAPC